MSEMIEMVDSLESKLSKLIEKSRSLELQIQDLKNELQQSIQIRQNQASEIEHLNKKYETLKIANSLLGSDENKRDTKLKINSLIREIDYCIAQLSD
jgi:FtsZ-binding cell division protein ZapB